MDNSKLGSLLGTAGVLAGLLIAVKSNKSIGVTALFAVGFGIGGYMAGNAITKFYE